MAKEKTAPTAKAVLTEGGAGAAATAPIGDPPAEKAPGIDPGVEPSPQPPAPEEEDEAEEEPAAAAAGAEPAVADEGAAERAPGRGLGWHPLQAVHAVEQRAFSLERLGRREEAAKLHGVAGALANLKDKLGTLEAMPDGRLGDFLAAVEDEL